MDKPPPESAPHPPTTAGPLPPPKSELEGYHRVADTVGMVPSLRLKDNLIQAAVIIGFTAVAALVGWLGWDLPGLAVGGIGGLIASTLLSGMFLMVLGWIRGAKSAR